jgi:hypothetical protein
MKAWPQISPLGFILWCIYQLAGWLSLLGFLEFKVLL